MRAVIGKRDYDEIISERNLLNKDLVSVIDKSIDEWGVSCTRFEMQRFEPRNEEVRRELDLKMQSDRRKRENDNNVEAKNATAVGERLQNITRSEGEAKAKENNALADLFSQQKKVDAVKYQLDIVSKIFNGDIRLASQYLIELAKLEQLKAIANGPNNAVYFIDQNTSSIVPNIKIAGDILVNKNIKV